MLIQRRHGSDIKDVRVCRGADVSTDHFMVLIKYKQRISTKWTKKTDKTHKFNVTPIINNLKLRTDLQHKLNQDLKNMEIDEKTGLEMHWNKMKTTILYALEDKLGYETVREKKEWFDSECERVIRERNQARMKMLQRETRTNRQEYENKRKTSKQVCRRSE